MYEWRRQIQQIVDEIDGCIRSHDDAALTLRSLSRTLGYSEYYTTRKFREISGMQLRDYLRRRWLAFALREVREETGLRLDPMRGRRVASHRVAGRFEDVWLFERDVALDELTLQEGETCGAMLTRADEILELRREGRMAPTGSFELAELLKLMEG